MKTNKYIIIIYSCKVWLQNVELDPNQTSEAHLSAGRR